MNELQDTIWNRLIRDGKGDESWALVVLAALEGTDALAAFL